MNVTLRIARGAIVSVTFAVLAFCLRPVAADEFAVAADAPVWQRDVGTAWQRAVAEDQPLLIFFSTASCAHCQKMKATFAEPDVAALLGESIVAVAVAVDGRRERRLAHQLAVRAYPTTLVVGPDGREVGRFEGYAAADVFRRDLVEAINLAVDPTSVADRPTRLR